MTTRACYLGTGVTSGTTITAANSGRAAGLPFSSVVIGAGATATWDNAHAFFGSVSMKLTTGGSGVNVYGRWDQMFRPAGPDIVVSQWLYFASTPAASTSVFYCADAAAARVTEIRVISTGQIRAYDASGTAAVTTTASIATGQWVRVDFLFTPHASAGKVQIKLYNTAASSTPTETTSQVTGLNLRTSTPTIWFKGISNSAANQSFWSQGFISDGAPAPFGTGWVLSRWIGGGTSTSIKATVRTAAAAAVRLKVSTASNLATSPVYSSSQVPDADGTVRLSVTGLTPNTQYYYGIEVDSVVDTEFNGEFRTLVAEGKPASYSFAAAACARNWSDSASFDAILAQTGPGGRKPLFFQHLGDLFYFAENTSVAVDFQDFHDRLMSSPKQNNFFGKIPSNYTWSDHDSGGSNHDGASAALPYAQVAYRSRVPSPTLPDANGIYYSYVVGRVRYIVTDGRSFMDPIAQTDDGDKSKLGDTQKTWFKARLLDPEPVKVWIHEDAWMGTTYVGDDQWTAYATERAELAAFITANNVRVAYIHGDLHALAADDSTNAVGDFPIFCASPLDNTAFIGNATWSAGTYPLADSVAPNYYLQYGWFDVTDTGDSITLAFKGMDSAGNTRITQSKTWSSLPWTSVTMLGMWDGTGLVPVTVGT